MERNFLVRGDVHANFFGEPKFALLWSLIVVFELCHALRLCVQVSIAEHEFLRIPLRKHFLPVVGLRSEAAFLKATLQSQELIEKVGSDFKVRPTAVHVLKGFVEGPAIFAHEVDT